MRIQSVVSPKLAKKIAREAKKKGVSVSRFIRELLEKYCEQV